MMSVTEDGSILSVKATADIVVNSLNLALSLYSCTTVSQVAENGSLFCAVNLAGSQHENTGSQIFTIVSQFFLCMEHVLHCKIAFPIHPYPVAEGVVDFCEPFQSVFHMVVFYLLKLPQPRVPISNYGLNLYTNLITSLAYIPL